MGMFKSIDEELTENLEKETNPQDSILLSVKKLLGITEDNKVFDIDIMIIINGVIQTLAQLGVGPSAGFIVTSKDDKYIDWIPDMTHFQSVKLYLFYKTKLSFDPPAQSSVMECLKEMAKEIECRLSYQVDPPDNF